MLPNLTSFNLETVVLQVTTNCPYACPQCYMRRGNQNMPVDVAKNVIDDARRLGAAAIQITGGEPMVYPYLFDTVKYATDAGLISFLATSGYGCSDDTYNRLKSAGLTAICISVNGISESANRKSRAQFEESLSAIQTAYDNGIPCFLNVVVTDDTIQELDLLGEYAKRKRVAGINILNPVSSHDGQYIPRLSHETIQAMAVIVGRSPEFFRVEGCHKKYWEYVTKKPFSCQDVGQTTYFVRVDGSVSPCSKLMKYTYGSLPEMLDQRHDWECGC